jgi:hypothetical protein
LSEIIYTIEIYWCALTKKGYKIDYHIESHGTGPLYCNTIVFNYFVFFNFKNINFFSNI